MNTAKTTRRERQSGRYAYSVDRVCTCGHRLGGHTEARTPGEQPCLADGCSCDVFTPRDN